MITMRRLFWGWTSRQSSRGMGQIMRKGAGTEGQVVNKWGGGSEGGYNPQLGTLPS